MKRPLLTLALLALPILAQTKPPAIHNGAVHVVAHTTKHVAVKTGHGVRHASKAVWRAIY